MQDQVSPAGAKTERHIVLGIAAGLLAVLIWASWVVATRHTMTNHLGLADTSLLRFGIPAILLAPVWMRTGLLPKGISKRLMIFIFAGSGLPFFLAGAGGLAFAPAAHFGVLAPGSLPLWAALIGMFFFGERYGPWRGSGLALITVGILIIGGTEVFVGTGGIWRGHLLLLLSSILWAGYTHAFKHSGLTALEAAALSSVWSAIPLSAYAIVNGTALGDIPQSELVLQVLAQGVGSGFIAIIAYGYSVQALGATPAAAFSALVPVLAALGGYVFLGETLKSTDMAGVAAVTVGVALATGMIRRKSRA